MLNLRTSPVLIRHCCAALLTLLLALRLLGTAGYMPAFEHGRATVIACPGAEGVAPLTVDARSHHHHDKTKHVHQECPYASAGTLGALGLHFPTLLDVLILAAALSIGRAFLFHERRRPYDRPPLRGPPIPV